MASSSSITTPSACLDPSPSPALSNVLLDLLGFFFEWHFQAKFVVFDAAGQFKIALCQLTVTSNKGENLARARISVESAVEKGAKLVMLPVSWICLLYVLDGIT